MPLAPARPRHELASLSPASAAALRADALPTRWRHLPMRDFGLADNVADFRAGIVTLASELAGGEVVLLHCAAGIGRTGTAAAFLLKSLGLPHNESLQCLLDAGSSREAGAH